MNANQRLQDQLRHLEERLLRPDVRRSPEELDKLLADDFREFGSSGRAFDKQQIMAALQTEQPCELILSDFQAIALSPELALVTYRAKCTAVAGGSVKHSLRSSIWKLENVRWRVLFHQGTRVDAAQ